MTLQRQLLSLSFLALLTGCPDTKNSDEVSQETSFPSFELHYAEGAKLTTAYAQVWENERKHTTLRLAGGASLSFDDQSMDLHDADGPDECCSHLGGTYYRRSMYDVPPKPDYTFHWDKADGSAQVTALVHGARPPKVLAPVAAQTIRRADGIRVHIEAAGYTAQEETLKIRIEDESGSSVSSDDQNSIKQVGAFDFLLTAERSWRLSAGKLLVSVTRTIQGTERKPDGSILFTTTARYEGAPLGVFLLDDD